jgi:TusA-related sulfurtransferase
MKEKPDYIIDFRQSITPLSLLRMGQLVKQMKPHELLEIIVRDPDVRSDVLKIVPGCELIGIELNTEEDFCRMQLEKKECSDSVSFDDADPAIFS